MTSGTIALAFTAGMVATFNPCGFSLLPAYIGAFVAGDEPTDGLHRRVARAIGVAAAVSVGFVLVFSTVGLIIDSIASEFLRELPWVTIVIGGLLIAAGGATVAGWNPKIALAGPQLSTGARGIGSMVGYGVTYAIASLSCTIGPFLAVTGAALSRSPLEGLATFVAYAIGMGVIVLVLSLASVFAHSTIATHLRRASRVAPRIGGTLMMLAGSYAVWYGRWELSVYDGDLGADPVIDAMERIRLTFVDVILRVGAERIVVVAVAATAAALLATRAAHTSVAADVATSDQASRDPRPDDTVVPVLTAGPIADHHTKEQR